MIKLFILNILATICFSTTAYAQRVDPVIITNVNVVDVITGTIQPNKTVVVQGERIIEIVDAVNRLRYKDHKRIKGKNQYLIPGLIDTHLHFNYQLNNNDWEALHTDLRLLVANGVTGIREAAGAGNQRALVAIRDSIKKDLLTGPEMYVSGICGPQNLKRFGVPDYASLIDSFYQIGVDGIKIKFVGRHDVKNIIDVATKYDLPVYGHTSNLAERTDDNLLGDFTPQAVEYGIKGVMHSMGYTPLKTYPTPPDSMNSLTSPNWVEWWLYVDALWLHADQASLTKLINRMVEKEVWLEPTLSIESLTWNHQERLKNKHFSYFLFPDTFAIYGFPHPIGAQRDTARMAFERKLSFVKSFVDAGGVLLAGTDNSLMGADLKEELAFFVEAGLTPAQALKTATYNNALALGWLDRYGTIEKGKMASMVLLKENPLEDVRALFNIAGVFLKGKYYTAETINNWLQEIKMLAAERKSKF